MKLASIGSCCALALAFSAVACSSSDKSSSTGNTDGAAGEGSVSQPVTVEVFSWWTAPGEAEALQSLIDLHKEQYPNSRIYNAATDPKVISGGMEAKAILQDRLKAGDPPDAFQTNAFELKSGFVADSPGLLRPLDDVFKSEGLDKDIAPEALADITVGGHYMAVPVNMHRENSMFYNKSVLAANGLKPPATMAEFISACGKLKKAKITPLAISTSQGWIVNKVYIAIAIASMGTDDFVKYFVDKKAVLDEAAVTPSVDLLDQVLTDCIDVQGAAMDGFGWTQAADALHDGSAAMFIHGDWAKGYLTQLGWTPDVDFGVTVTPDGGDVFVYGMDVFAVPAGAKHADDALDWVRTIASPDGQVAFNEYKGSSPVRLNVPVKGLDAMAQSAYSDFKASKHRIPSVNLPGPWNDAFVALAKDHDKAAFIKVVVDNPL